MRLLRRGDVIDRRYKIQNRIGVGGMGEVYRARRTRLGDVVAIKVIQTQPDDAASVRRRFMAEARMCAMLHHPNIVSVVDFGVEADVGPYLVMEHLNGVSLRQHLEQHGALDVPEVCAVASQIAGALDLAHSQGVVHQDVKPGNVMRHHYSAGEVVCKVIDFGIGSFRGGRTSRLTTDENRAVRATVAYASPEQLEGEEVTAQSDIYSFGVMLYELLTGHSPFLASDPRALIAMHLNEPPPPLSRFRPALAGRVEDAVLKALAKAPQDRWQTASDFAAALSAPYSAPAPIVAMSASRLATSYEIGARIGGGRLGSDIHEGTHRPTGQQVAIRLIRRENDTSWDAARTRFMREARMTPVNHPSILRVRDFGEEPDMVYVVTDFVPGFSLREVLDRDGAFPWDRGQPLMLDLISATRALHTRGLLAFGLTPSIIRVAADDAGERLVISLAGVLDADELLETDQHGALEMRSEMLYLAPELLVGETPDGRTDIFTIGAIGYELFTGHRPFAATTLPQLVLDAFSGEIPDPRPHAPSMPEAAATCLLRSLAWRPDRRFADIVELESAFRASSSARPGDPAPA